MQQLQKAFHSMSVSSFPNENCQRNWWYIPGLLPLFIFLILFINTLQGAFLEVEYDINIKFSEPTHTIYGYETVHIRNTSSFSIDTIYVHLSPNGFRSTESHYYQRSEDLLEDPVRMSIQSISSNGAACRFFDNEYLSMGILLPSPLVPQDSVNISIDFTITIPRGNHPRCPTYKGSTYKLIRFIPTVERFTEKGWSPASYNTIEPSCRSHRLYRLKIQLPEKYNVISSLPLESTQTVNSGEIVHSFKPLHIQDLAIVFSASYQLSSTFFRETPVYLLFPLSKKNNYINPVNQIIEYLTIDILNLYSGLFIPYPHKQLSLTTAGIPNGFTTSNLIILDKKMYRNLAKLDYASIYGLAHAIAKEYFKFYILENPNQSEWLNDGLTNLAASIYMSRNYRQTLAHFHIKEHPQQTYYNLALRLSALAFDQKQISQPLYISSNKNSSFVLLEQIRDYKGQKILEMLNYYIGDSLFQICIRELLYRYQHSPVSADKFFKIVEELSGKDLTLFQQLWIESDNIPDIRIKRVKREYIKKENRYFASVITQGEALNVVPVEVIAVNAKADTLQTFTQLTTNGIDTVAFSSPSPIRKISLDPHCNIWESNRLNNHYPHKILFNFLFGIPQIDAYQIFYYPTFDFNKWDVTRIGVKLRGCYWINMRTLFPAQSLDKWTVEINYGLKSKTGGYDVSYSTSLFSVFFRPRINFRSRDYYGLNQTSIISEIYIGKIKYPLFYRIHGYKKLNFGIRYENVRTLKFLNSSNWEQGKLLSPFIDFVNFHNWGNYRHVAHLSLSAGLPWFDTKYSYTKLILDTQFKLRTSHKSWLYERLFIGVSDNQLPRQRLFYFFGKNILENLSFESYRLAKGAGDMRGYGAASLKGKNILTSNTEVHWSFATYEPAVFDIILFFDSGVIPKTIKNISLNKFKYDAGVGVEFNALETIMVGIHFPFWVSHPVDDKRNFALRWLISLDLNL